MNRSALDPTAKYDADQFVNKSAIASHYSVSTRTIDNWIQRRIIPYVKIRGVVRFRISEVDAAIARFEVKLTKAKRTGTTPPSNVDHSDPDEILPHTFSSNASPKNNGGQRPLIGHAACS